MSIASLQNTLYEYAKLLEQSGLVSESTGNMSARDPSTGQVVIKVSGVPYRRMSERDFILLTGNGEKTDPTDGRYPSYEMPTHMEIYRRFPEIHSVFHTHSKYTIVLGAVLDEIPCATTPTENRLLKKPVPFVPFIEHGTQDMANAIAPYFEKNVAVVIRNHGPFVVGGSVEEAYTRAVSLENAAKTVYAMKLLGHVGLIS